MSKHSRSLPRFEVLNDNILRHWDGKYNANGNGGPKPNLSDRGLGTPLSRLHLLPYTRCKSIRVSCRHTAAVYDLAKMHRPTATRLLRSLTQTTGCPRHFSSTAALQAQNRVYPNRIRSESDLSTLTLMSASMRVPLLTFWMANWCQTCKAVSPMIQELIDKERVGEEQGGVSFVEVEMDSPDLGGLAGIGMRYGITSIPTLLAFDRQEPQIETRVSRLDDLKNRQFLTRWIEKEAARRGEGGAGGGLFGLFGR